MELCPLDLNGSAFISHCMPGHRSAKTRTSTSVDSWLKLAAIKKPKLARGLGDISTFRSGSPGFKHQGVGTVYAAHLRNGSGINTAQALMGKYFHTINE